MFALLLTQAAFTCDKENPEPTNCEDCTTLATVRDLKGLDGCGYVLELPDGKRLEPSGKLWQDLAKQDGAKVKVSYEPEPRASICMVGETVKVTCLRRLQSTGN
ncbi:hypothetical protein D3Y59_02120 [Hymenobacter oligotrophus]|uniref:Uncharacterized protein n=2 Tax=Hymenobacter oligotrophus TaxID=2319843 RepID=A0A3B7QX96_9BACT|nr:hypothetical protein D3Y59_02120 [Hymenobacter oligotrophus]